MIITSKRYTIVVAMLVLTCLSCYSSTGSKDGPPPPTPPPPPPMDIDNGIILLLISALVFGYLKFSQFRLNNKIK